VRTCSLLRVPMASEIRFQSRPNVRTAPRNWLCSSGVHGPLR
jgi:hypothetical protein